jgi:hypothetical protein
MKNFGLQSIVQRTLLKIKKNICHPMTICIFGFDAEYDKIQKSKQMIDSKNLLENYTIQHRIESILYSMEMI